MPFPLNLLAPRTSQQIIRVIDNYDENLSSSSSSTESNETVRTSRGSANVAARPRVNLQRASPTQPSSPTAPSHPDYLFPTSNVPSAVPSRSSSPLPIHYASPGASSSSYTSDADSEPTSPLLGLSNARRTSWWNDDARRWWLMGSHSQDARRRRRRLRSEPRYGVRTIKRHIRRVIRHPYFPKQPTTIILTLLIFTAIAILITLLLMHILNPDKASLPWRAYCSIPYTSTAPPSLTLSPTEKHFSVQVPVGVDPSGPNSPLMNHFSIPAHLDVIPPAGLFLGVFTTDSAIERRMLIRSTWASQERSRAGASGGDGGNGTSRTIVRFVLGKPRSGWERRIQLESETYNDIVVLPIAENMNSGKTHAFFTWAAENAWVPAPSSPGPRFSYSNYSVPAPPLAAHDPDSARLREWVRPDFVVKADEDSFVMLAELEARLRAELDNAIRATVTQHARHLPTVLSPPPVAHPTFDGDSHISSQSRVKSQSWEWFPRDVAHPFEPPTYVVPDGDTFSASGAARMDPLIYWGYLVKNRFMAGELYALSWSIVDWVAKEATLKSMTRGAEDKQTAKWLRLHPRAEEVRWASERCWIYDHPRAGTVYSHGFLFPSEATRVRRSILSLLRPLPSFLASTAPGNGVSGSVTHTPVGSGIGESRDTKTYALPSPSLATTPSYSYSSVSQFGTHYSFPLTTLTPAQSIEALVEGSATSALFEGGPETAAQAWEKREGRRKRYEGQRVGGTVVVHFIKRNEWFLETALALLGGEEVVAGEESEESAAEMWERAQVRGGPHLAMAKRRQHL